MLSQVFQPSSTSSPSSHASSHLSSYSSHTLSRASLHASNSSPQSSSSSSSSPDESNLSLTESYHLYSLILHNPYFLRLAAILLTNRIGVFPAEAAATLRLLDKGMESVRLTSLRMAYFPLEMLVTVALGRLLTRVHPLRLVQRFYLLRVTMALLTALFIHALPDAEQGQMARRFYPPAFLLVVLSSVAGQAMNVSAMTYFAQISDPRFGGSYMSLFNTISNLGHNMYVSPVLSLIDLLSRRQCVQQGRVTGSCVSRELYRQCAAAGGRCETLRDGFYLLAWPTFFYGIAWSIVTRKQFEVLRNGEREKWKVV
ncbi:hypothetical protein WA538_000110, partial [Blastocystis sp. DL]